jgi:hypothetical protein
MVDLEVLRAQVLGDGEALDALFPVAVVHRASAENLTDAEVDDLPDFMINDECLSPPAARAERILLFLLGQPDQRYASPENTAAKDIAQILVIENHHRFKNTLASLRQAGLVWVKKENEKRTIALGLDGEKTQAFGGAEFFTERVRAKVTRTEFVRDNSLSHDVEDGFAAIHLSDEQRDICLAIGEAELAQTAPDSPAEMAERFGGEASGYVSAANELITRGLIR